LPPTDLPEKSWAVAGREGRGRQTVVKSLYLGDGELEAHNWRLHAKYQLLAERETRWEGLHLEGADLVVTAFGSAARIAKTAVRLAREEGRRVGLLRPITLFPFPAAAFRSLAGSTVLCVELNAGQMVQDVRLSVAPGTEVAFYGRPPGAGSLPVPEELLEQIRRHCEVRR
ncbi:MAG: 3-methyl-2-oxobutanoate dehydrogenase subunit beta, partial [Desulfuromonadales bacterium]|nr:3-methyl-2-oxobutanoate dehydrogenase subunit beta [Desulfuromonadales bacterium]